MIQVNPLFQKLQIFFFNDGKGVVKVDKNDINKYGIENGNNEISIAICFDDLPKSVILDSSFETDLEKEILLNS